MYIKYHHDDWFEYGLKYVTRKMETHCHRNYKENMIGLTVVIRCILYGCTACVVALAQIFKKMFIN